ncbi:MAG TPA: PilX N-terminal domain-containing pilus assembly protein, partial [Pseudoxanthomonas sp.]|nr:PilX N-terminal domain-containing pilus assembly protein [Pseudoxanthomonas sp.]
MTASHSSQRGAATLLVVLILLLVVALIGLASLRGTLMEERMSAGV